MQTKEHHRLEEELRLAETSLQVPPTQAQCSLAGITKSCGQGDDNNLDSWLLSSIFITDEPICANIVPDELLLAGLFIWHSALPPMKHDCDASTPSWNGYNPYDGGFRPPKKDSCGCVACWSRHWWSMATPLGSIEPTPSPWTLVFASWKLVSESWPPRRGGRLKFGGGGIWGKKPNKLVEAAVELEVVVLLLLLLGLVFDLLLFLRQPPPTGTFLRAPPRVQYRLHDLQKWRGWVRL